MEVTVEEVSQLGRKMVVSIPADSVKSAIDEKLKKVAKTVRLDGFRPGKVPISVVKQRFGNVIRDEVHQEQVKNTLENALKENDLAPAATPDIEVTENGGDDKFQYVVTFDILPKLELAEIDESIEIVKDIAEIKPIDVERTLKRLREQHAEFVTVERAAQTDDQLTIDFEGSIDGELFEGGSAESVPLVLGSNSMIPGFEEQLIGAEPGSEVEIKVPFPEDYHAKDLAGKEAIFKTKVHEIKEKKLPVLDDSFAEKFGLKDGGMAKLRSELQETLKRECKSAEYSLLKKRVMDRLLELNKVELPETMVEQEIKQLQMQQIQKIKQQLGQMTADMDQLAQLSQLGGMDPEQLREQAERRVSLGLILSEFIKQESLELDQARLQQKVREIADLYEDPQEALGWIFNDKNRLAEIEGLVMEEQIVDKVLEKVTIAELTGTYDKIINLSQTEV